MLITIPQSTMTSRVEYITATQVIVHANDGLVGYGETPRNVGLGAVQFAAQQVIGKTLRQIAWAAPISPDFSDHDMFGHEDPPVPPRLYENDFHATGGAMGVIVALQDLIAKSAGMRLCDLIGGPCRERIVTDWWMARTDSEHAVR